MNRHLFLTIWKKLTKKQLDVSQYHHLDPKVVLNAKARRLLQFLAFVVALRFARDVLLNMTSRFLGLEKK